MIDLLLFLTAYLIAFYVLVVKIVGKRRPIQLSPAKDTLQEWQTLFFTLDQLIARHQQGRKSEPAEKHSEISSKLNTIAHRIHRLAEELGHLIQKEDKLMHSIFSDTLLVYLQTVQAYLVAWKQQPQEQLLPEEHQLQQMRQRIHQWWH